MKKPIVSEEFDLIQYGGNTFVVPISINIRKNLGYLNDVLKERILLTEKMGIVFMSDNGAFACNDCSYSGIIEAAQTEVFVEVVGLDGEVEQETGVATNDASSYCGYKLISENPQWLSYFSRSDNGTEIGFAARMKPCVVDTGLLVTIINQGKLNKYKVDNDHIDATQFPFITQIKPNTESERNAVELYQESFDSKQDVDYKPNLFERIKNHFNI